MISRAEVAMVWRLFRADAAHNRKRIALTVLAIAWGTLSIVLLLSFGEGMKRAFHRTSRGMGENIGVLWPGATTKPYAGLPSGRTLQFTDEDAEIMGARIPEIASISREYNKRVPVSHGTKSVNARVRGVDPSFGPMRNLIPAAGGRFPNELDLAETRPRAAASPTSSTSRRSGGSCSSATRWPPISSARRTPSARPSRSTSPASW
jgi:putative ABC transport system permease protein